MEQKKTSPILKNTDNYMKIKFGPSTAYIAFGEPFCHRKCQTSVKIKLCDKQ